VWCSVAADPLRIRQASRGGTVSCGKENSFCAALTVRFNHKLLASNVFTLANSGEIVARQCEQYLVLEGNQTDKCKTVYPVRLR
jgi:hypothetical protein